MRAAAVIGCVVLFVAAVAAQRGDSPGQRSLPPVSFTCVHHPDVVESRPGSCPFCKMALVPVRLDSAWTCPIHNAVVESSPGTCPVCRRPLNRVTVSVGWTCRNDAAVERLEPGTCSDGTPMVMRRTLRPHGNHNPQHGGQFFMASDNWHHLEGTYPRERVFRMYIYDDYARPLSADRLKKIRGRVVTKETFDPRTRTTTERAAFTLRLVRNAEYLEARLDQVTFPLDVTAKVTFDDRTDEHRFDFTFTQTTKDSAPSANVVQPRESRRTNVPTAPPADVEPARAIPVNKDEPDLAVDTAVLADPSTQTIPTSMQGMVDLLRSRSTEVAALIERGEFSAVWVPAFQAKEVALALQPHLSHLSPAQREIAAPALRDFVRAAWLLDAYADVGNRLQIEAAYQVFAAAGKDLASAFAER